MTDQHLSIYSEISGGQELLRWFGRVPNFHDAEILSLELCSQGQSVLRVRTWVAATTPGVHVPERHVVVSFILEGIQDLQLHGFNSQNVIGGLVLRRARDRPGGRDYLALDSLPNDIEIGLEPCYGLEGFIRARSVAIAFNPGEPNARTSER